MKFQICLQLHLDSYLLLWVIWFHSVDHRAEPSIGNVGQSKWGEPTIEPPIEMIQIDP